MNYKGKIWPSVLFIGGVVVLIILALLSGCTSNERAKAFGGTQTITLAAGEKVINVTWKNADMWILVELPNGSKEFREYSNWGVMNGKVVFK